MMIIFRELDQITERVLLLLLLLCVQLDHVTLEDAGVYTVTARNIAGCVSTSAILVIGHGLRQLLLLDFCLHKDQTPLLQFVVHLLYNLMQRGTTNPQHVEGMGGGVVYR